MKLTILKNIQSTILMRLLFYFILIILITLSASSYFTYNYFSSSFKGEITDFNNRVLSQLSLFSDDFIFKSINKMALDIAINDSDYSAIMKTTSDPLKDYPGMIYNNCKNLSDLVISNNNIIDSICIHSKKNNLLLTSSFAKKIDEETASASDEFNWISSFYKSGRTLLWLKTRNVHIYSDMSRDKGDIITVVCSYPLSATGIDVEGCIAVNIKEDVLNQYLVTYNSSKSGQLMIIDNNGTLVSHNDKNSLYKDISGESFIKEILDSGSRGSFRTVYEKEKYIVSFIRSGNNNWYYVSLIPTELFYQKDYFIKKKIFIISTIILFSVFILSNIFSFIIYKPLRKILNKYIPAFHSPATCKNINEYYLLDSLFSNASNRISDLQDTLDKNALMIRHNFFIELLNNKITDPCILADLLKFSNIKFPKQYFSVVVFIIDKNIVSSNQQSKVQFFKYSLIDYIKNIKNNSFFQYPVDIGSTTISVIINSNENSTETVKLFTQNVWDFCFSNFELNIIVGIGKCVNDLIAVNKSYVDAIMCLQYRFLNPDRSIFGYEDIVQKPVNNFEYNGLTDKLDKYLRLENYEEIENVLKRFCSMSTTGKVSYILVKKEISKLIVILKQYVDDKNIDINEILNESMKKVLLFPNNINEFVKAYLLTVKMIFDYLADKRLNRNRMLVEMAKQYIIDNLHLELSLNFTADAIHVSAFHLSRIFKEEAGINYIDYVTRCKLDKAKDLLASTNLPIDEVTSRIGYSHATYFCKKFKEVIGKTPNEYRTEMLCKKRS